MEVEYSHDFVKIQIRIKQTHQNVIKLNTITITIKKVGKVAF